VGWYTAGAVASIAYSRRVPAVDGNVRRVLGRLLPGEVDSSCEPTDAVWRKVAGRLVPASAPGDFNQALMELGARVCTPTAPKCDACPLARVCPRAGTTGPEPSARRRRPARRELRLVTLAIESDGRLYFEQRPAGGLWSGLWQWPTAGLEAGQSALHVVGRLLRRIVPGSRKRSIHLEGLVHPLTHRTVVFEAFAVLLNRRPRERSPGRWIPCERWAERLGASGAPLPVSAAQRKLLAGYLHARR